MIPKEVQEYIKKHGVMATYMRAAHALATENLEHDDYLIFEEVEKLTADELERLRGELADARLQLAHYEVAAEVDAQLGEIGL